ncbi:MAG: hypothetical protein JWP85_2286 [Rhodoglobus sp.]|nr:hypothetical protein [Rhodoglobus sp.]
MPSTRTRRRRWPWIVGGIALILLVPIAVIAVPILAHRDQGLPNQQQVTDEWPLVATATGDDGRHRSFKVLGVDGASVDTSALEVGQHLIVKGAGYDGSQGIYVAICVIPADPATKPGPCVGGVPDQQQTEVEAGTVQFAPSNWINDDWAWKLFGARSFDDIEAGTFTAYIEVGQPLGDDFDCRVDACGLYTRNDHTALGDRVQDLYVPVAWAN